MKYSQSFTTNDICNFRSEPYISEWISERTDGHTSQVASENDEEMATKSTVALAVGIVLVVVIAILIIANLTSPSRFMPNGETSQTGRTVTAILSANNSTTIDMRRIIVAPPRNCADGEKRDKFGVCRQKWWLGQSTLLTMPNTR
jgi:uncharacterized integral membrane protein